MFNKFWSPNKFFWRQKPTNNVVMHLGEDHYGHSR